MLIVLVYILDLLIWGSAWVAIKIGLETMGPFTSATLRLFIAFILMAMAFRLWRFRFPVKRHVRRDLFLCGIVMNGVYFALVYWGQQHINASTAAILFCSMPFFVALCAHFMLPDEKLTLRTVMGMLIGFGGTVIFFSNSLTFSGSTLGMLAILASSFSASWATVKVKRDLGMIRSTTLATLQLPPGLLLLVPATLAFEYPLDLNLDANAAGSILYLAIIVTGGAFVAWYWLLKRIPAVAASLMTFIEPVVATILSVLILSESLSSQVFIGGCLILIGVLIVILKRKPGMGSIPRQT